MDEGRLFKVKISDSDIFSYQVLWLMPQQYPENGLSFSISRQFTFLTPFSCLSAELLSQFTVTFSTKPFGDFKVQSTCQHLYVSECSRLICFCSLLNLCRTQNLEIILQTSLFNKSFLKLSIYLSSLSM